MRKLFLSAFCALFGLSLAQAAPQQKIVGTPTDSDNVEIIDLNITPAARTAFSAEIGSSLTTRDGTFIKTSTGEGSGQTKEIATRNAVLEAISKLKGLSAEKNLNLQSLEVPTLFGTVLTNPQMSAATKGRIDSYDIISVNIEPNGWYMVRVNVYKTLFERSKKPSVTIINASRFKELGETLQRRLTNDLVQSKKFNVLDRKNDAYYKAEKQLIESEDASSEDVYKLGNILGTDYMLIVNLRDLGKSSSSSSGVASTSTSSKASKADVVVDYQMILFATKEVKLANTLTLTLSLKDGGVKANEEAMGQISKAVSTDILNTLYPLVVAAMQDKEITFADRLDANAIYECGSGRVQVTKSAQTSKAKILSGEVAVGDVCKVAIETGKEANYKLGTNGGVNLGW